MTEMSTKSMFISIPDIDVKNGTVGDVVHYGAGNYVVRVDHTTKEEYDNYLLKLENSGYTKYVDNGAGINGQVFLAIYVQREMVLHVAHMSKINRTYVSASMDQPLSNHLFYKDEYVKDNKKGAKTTLHLLEMWRSGNSLLIQLKNGHFIMSDGGTHEETKYLLDYIRTLTPVGEKPVIEAWFITHAHGDHCAVMEHELFWKTKEFRNEFCVEGVYYNEPHNRVFAMDPLVWYSNGGIKLGTRYMKDSNGEYTQIYRPQTGQRYYFNDVTIDIIHAQEQLPREDYLNEDYPGDFNDSSTWYMVTIDGQKVLFTGDGDIGSMDVIMKTYDKEYLNVNIMTLPHHGFNTSYKFVDTFKVKTVLATVRDRTPVCRKKQNEYFKEHVEEWLSWGDGTKILTFPYQVGEFQCLPNFEWIYNKGQERPIQGNLDVEV